MVGFAFLAIYIKKNQIYLNEYFVNLIEKDWKCVSWPSQKAEDNNEYWNCNRFEPVDSDGKPAHVRVAGDKYTLAMLPTDLTLKFTPELSAIASEFIGSDGESCLFRSTFAGVWEKLMNNDRFDGQTGNVCH